MTDFHVAIDHLESPDPNTPQQQVQTTYLGIVDQAHVDQVRAIAGLEDSPRFVKDHPHIEGAFMVLRDDGDLDVYVPVGAPEYRVYEPDRLPKSRNEGGDFAGEDAQFVQKKSSAAYSDEDLLPRGASGPAYISGAVKFGGQSIGGAMDTPGNPPRVVWHTTESPAGGNYFASIAAYLIRVASEPQVIYDPVTDKLGQFGPLTKSGRALKNDGSRRTNREGKVCIQVEVLGRAANPWTKGFDPAAKPNFRKLLAAARAHGVPDVWPAGKPKGTAAEVAKGSRSRNTWQSKGGHYGHGHAPGNSHWDPGAIDTAIVPGKPSGAPAPGTGGGTSSTTTYTVKDGDTVSSIAKAHRTTVGEISALNQLANPDKLSIGQKMKVPALPAPKPSYEPFPGVTFFHGGRNSPIITALGRRLVALGFGRHYNNGPGPDWTNADKRNVRDFQLSRDDLKADADGIPGPMTWAALKIPKV
ncbi:peptidoglycan-binding protein [Streptomyces sp. NPDC060001]|uniref:peptidoglycan-binding protein n=1 Tax=Streptomyces sp. NPDC060001 TaxID=3347032 RepID=UPI0036789E53